MKGDSFVYYLIFSRAELALLFFFSLRPRRTAIESIDIQDILMM